MSKESWMFDGELQRRRSTLTDSGYDIYCLYCMTGREIKTACELNQKHNSFLIMPFLRMMHKSKNGKRYLAQDVLLKGYVFLFVPQSASISEIENDPDVYYVLERKNGAGKLREADLRYAKWVLEMDGLLKASKAVRIGERVKIVEGPLLELEGHIKEYSKKNRNCRVQLDIVGQQLSVWLPFDWVEASNGAFGIAEGG